MLFTLSELIDATGVSLLIAYIFKDFFSRGYGYYYFDQKNNVAFLNALAFVSPAIILHELGHKLTAIAFGYSATFHAAWLWIFIALILKSINFPFIIFVPAYVSTNATGFANFFIALAGPFTNLLLYLLTPFFARIYPSKHWRFFAGINWFLFIFNMLPLPGFDGFHALISLFNLF